MFAFWIAAAALSAATGWLMLRGARAAAFRAGGEDPALAVHRRALAEIDEMAERGLLPEAERRAARAEAGRRLLAAAEAAPAAAGQDGRRAALFAAATAPVLALGIYLAVGAPGTPDQPFTARLAAWTRADPGQLDPQRIAAILRARAARTPRDPEVFRHLAMAELMSGDAMAATAALRRAVALAPGRADLWAALGEAFVAEGEGEVGVDARKAFGEALKRDPQSLSARYFLARADIADGSVDKGLAGWRALLASLPADAPSRAALASEIAAVERAGGLPGAAARPDEAAIRGMVEGLAARLERERGTPEDWVRLVRAWSVLGETAKRDAALIKAKALFADQPTVLQALEEAAR